MKYIIIILACTAITFCSSCKDTWPQEDKDAFYQSCMDDANTWAGSKENAKTYCDCVMKKLLKKYPHENDALDHIDSIINDPDIQACKAPILKQQNQQPANP